MGTSKNSLFAANERLCPQFWEIMTPVYYSNIIINGKVFTVLLEMWLEFVKPKRNQIYAECNDDSDPVSHKMLRNFCRYEVSRGNMCEYLEHFPCNCLLWILQLEISISSLGSSTGFICFMIALMAIQAPQLDSGGGKRSIYSILQENIGVPELFARLYHC